MSRKKCLINYAKNDTAWERGDAVFSYYENALKKNPVNAFSSQEEYEWYLCYRKFGKWPHPQHIIQHLMNSLDLHNKNAPIIWIPRLNYLIIELEKEEDIKFITDNIKEVVVEDV